MYTFIIGLIILIGGGSLYGRFCEKVFRPDDRKTPAYANEDGVDYVPMKQWKNCLVNLLNIAGTGPILGPIQGILFGPVAFITIPIGCVIGGAMHDYFAGMICTREGGIQTTEMVRRNLARPVFWLFSVFVGLTMFLCGTVFIYTPGDIVSTQLFGFGGTAKEPSTWIIFGVIFAYYLIATVLPIDKIIGKVYPIFGGLLILSAIGILVMLFVKGYPLAEIWGDWQLGGFDFGAYFRSQNFIPTFFVTVACGILSGFHSTQTALISRTIESEKHGRMTFYNMMILEGFIALIWAAGAMAMIGLGADNAGITMKFTDSGWGYYQNIGGTLQQISPTSVVGVVCKNMLGDWGGSLAIIGVIILPISTGDTALRALRLTIAELFHIEQKKMGQRLFLALPLFVLVTVILIWAKNDPNGFSVIWRYFGWANQTVSIFVTSSIMVWMIRSGRGKFAFMPAIPFVFYCFVISTYILSSPIGLKLAMNISYIIGGVFTTAALTAVIILGVRGKKCGSLRAG